MMAPGHATHGAIAGLVLVPLAPQPLGPIPSAALFVGLAVVGALVPDLDHPKSRLTHALPPVTWLLNKVLVRLSKAIFYATRTDRDYKDTNGHRGFTHTPVFAAVVAVGVTTGMEATSAHRFAVLVGAALGAGCLAHICGDSLTNSGVPWLWPLVDRRTGRRWQHYGIPKRLRFETGGGTHPRALTWAAKGEHITTVVSGAVAVLVPVTYLWLGWGL
jgi:inner membrane protein